MNQSIVSILEWNINQRAGHRGIPPWVLDEVVAKDPDIIVLTEFCQLGGGIEFLNALSKNYQCFTSQHHTGNNVMIAVKNHFHVRNVAWTPCYGKGVKAPDSIPENLRVDIDCGGTILTVIGVRIKASASFKSRRAEFEWIRRQLEGVENPIIIAGDFNNNRRGVEKKFDQKKTQKEERWSMVQIDHMLSPGFLRITPSGSSIWEAAKDDPGDEFAEDHFIIKGIQAPTLFSYDRSFTKNDKKHYPAEEDFQWFEDGAEKVHCARNRIQYKKYQAKYGESHRIDSGFPDHAILRGIFTLKDPDSPADQ